MSQYNVAYFITPHGFGHAARSASVMNAILEINPKAYFHIFALSPVWFFMEALPNRFTYYPTQTDIGLIQKTPLSEDLDATIQRLDEFIPFDKQLINLLAQKCMSTNCQMVICDIAPLGIVVAQTANLPSILIENFTWSWIYEGYLTHNSCFQPHIDYLKSVVAQADHHIQTEPVTNISLQANLITNPVSRNPKLTPAATRRKLNIQPDEKMILISMGGIEEQFTKSDQLSIEDGLKIIIPGGSESGEIRTGNLILLPHHSRYYHPDLVHACDAVIGKVGYSTIAEIYHAGSRFAYVARPAFRESKPLCEFIKSNICSVELSPDEFSDHQWHKKVEQLLYLPQITHPTTNGANQIAQYIKNNV